MISWKTFTHLLGVSLFFGVVATPLLAYRPDQTNSDFSRDPAPSVPEIVYLRYAQVTSTVIDEPTPPPPFETEDGDDDPVAISPPSVSVTETQTTKIVNKLNQIQQICEFMGDEYKIACFATTYRQLANEVPANGDYAETRQVLLDTARKLDTLMRENLDRQKPPLRARLETETGEVVATRPMRAVQSQISPQLNQQASSIVAEAETILLRSASADSTRAIHFQRIAAAVGSNKVLLRST